jgi:hypothetical protein
MVVFHYKCLPPQTWNGKWPDFGRFQQEKVHNSLYWYKIFVLRELAKQQFIYFEFKHPTD